MFSKLKNRRSDLIAMIIIVAAIFLYTLPLLLRLDKALTLTNKNCITAWYRTYFLVFYPYASILFERQFPFWCSFIEGGFPWIVYPSELSCNLFSLFMLPFGVIRGLNFSWYILYFAGAISMFYLARKVLKYDVYGAIYSSLVFSMCGFFPYMQGLGLWTRETLLLPLLVGLFLRSKHHNKYILLTGLVLSLFVHTILFFPVVVLFLFVITVVSSIKKTNIGIKIEKRYPVVFASSLVLAIFFSAYKLLPVIELLRTDMRVSALVYNKAIEQPNTFALLARHMFVPENSNVGTMYLGFLPVLLCVLSSLFLFKRVKKWFVILLIFIILSFGPNSFLDLHYFLWHLPIFKSIREISKYYALITVFLVSLISGHFFILLFRGKPGRFRKILPGVIIFITFMDLFWANLGYFNSYNTDLKLETPKNYLAHVKAINIHKGDEGGMEPLRLSLYLNGFGFINAHYHYFVKYFKEPFVSPKYFIMPEYVFISPSTKMLVISNPGYRGEAYFLNKKNKVDFFSITPKFIDVKVNVVVPDKMVINQKYSKGWKSKYGAVINHNGLLAINVKKLGTNKIRLSFVPLSFYIGITIAILSVFGALFFLIRSNNKRLSQDKKVSISKGN